MEHATAAVSDDNVTLVSQTAKHVARRYRLSEEDAEDFVQTVHLKLLERGYDVFARFAGRSSVRTYLTVVVTRLLLDWRKSTNGRWRPSAAALRLGSDAVRIEQLVARDGCTTEQAIEILLPGGTRTAAELRSLADSLPVRQRRRVFADDSLDYEPGETFCDPVAADEQRQTKWSIHEALVRACRQLPLEDRRLICLRYQRMLSFQAIGRLLKLDAKQLYRRHERVLAALRRALVKARVTGPATFSQPRVPDRFEHAA